MNILGERCLKNQWRKTERVTWCIKFKYDLLLLFFTRKTQLFFSLRNLGSKEKRHSNSKTQLVKTAHDLKILPSRDAVETDLLTGRHAEIVFPNNLYPLLLVASHVLTTAQFQRKTSISLIILLLYSNTAWFHFCIT